MPSLVIYSPKQFSSDHPLSSIASIPSIVSTPY